MHIPVALQTFMDETDLWNANYNLLIEYMQLLKIIIQLSLQMILIPLTYTMILIYDDSYQNCWYNIQIQLHKNWISFLKKIVHEHRSIKMTITKM